MASELELEPLDADVRALLDGVDRLDAKADAAIVARVRDRVDIALAAGASIDPATPPAPGSRTARRLGDAPIRQALLLTGTFVAGALTALAVERAFMPARLERGSAPPAIVDVAPARPAPSGSPDVAPTAAPSAIERPNERATPMPVVAKPASSSRAPASELRPSAEPARDGDLAAETRLVDTARAALAHGDFAAALAAATTHERRFPAGRLAEEREAILIQALAGARRGDDARARADAFRARYPSSFFLPLVERAVSSPP